MKDQYILILQLLEYQNMLSDIYRNAIKNNKFNYNDFAIILENMLDTVKEYKNNKGE